RRLGPDDHRDRRRGRPCARRVPPCELRRPPGVPSADRERTGDPRGRLVDDRPRAAEGGLAMFGLDERIATFSNGTTLLIVVAVSVLLGLRHASDPDHLAAVTTMIASGKERAARRPARLGFTWGLGHATSLFVFGLPVILYSAYLPAAVQRAAETSVGFVIVLLSLLLLLRWRRGAYHHAAGHTHAARTGLQAYPIGLVHGMGGTAGVGLLLLATIHSHVLAVAAL